MNDTATPLHPRFTGVRLLTSNDDAWQAKRHLIANASRTLDLCYFILEVDASTSRLLLDLIDAAGRGVKVRLLVDYFLTFKQAAMLRALANVPNIEVRRYGPPQPGWLNALQEAGIVSGAFVRGMMKQDSGMLWESLKGNTIFPQTTVDALQALKPEAGENTAGFQSQVLSALPSVAELASATAAPAIAAGASDKDRDAALRKVALIIAIIRGLKHFLHRTHHKLLLTDGQWFQMGGRNLADAYQCDRLSEGHVFQDTDLIARDGRKGGSEHLLTFEKLWCSAETADIRQPDPLDTRPPEAIAQLEDRACKAPAPYRGAAIERGVALPDMDGVLFDNLPSEKGDATITRAYVAQIERLIASGRGGVIDVVNAYLLLLDDAADSPSLLALRDAFVAAVSAGITVNIRTNSLASTDLKPVNRAAYPKLIALIDAGVNIFELGVEQGSLHAKCAAIGDACLIVGSYNLDPRSELYDTNNLIVFEEPSGVATAALRKKWVEGFEWTRLTGARVRELAALSKPSSAARIIQGPL